MLKLLPAESAKDMVELYPPIREAVNAHLNRVARHVDREIARQRARALGLVGRDGQLRLDETTSVILVDHCVFDVYDGDGRNLVDRYFDAWPAAPDTLDQAVEDALRAAEYTMLRIHETDGAGLLRVSDFFDEAPSDFELVDFQLSRSADPDMLLAGRILPFADFWITSGTMLPVDGEGLMRIVRALKSPPADGLDELQIATIFAERMIRACLKSGAAERVRYLSPTETSLSLTGAPRRSRNDACPCGSGRKYKRCCGANGAVAQGGGGS
jgi:hypothetical protein